MTGSQCQSLRLLCERNHELDTEAEAFLLGYPETGNASDAYRRAYDAAPTVCTSMTLVDDKGRSMRLAAKPRDQLGYGPKHWDVALPGMHLRRGSASWFHRSELPASPPRPSTSRLEGLNYTPLDWE